MKLVLLALAATAIIVVYLLCWAYATLAPAYSQVIFCAGGLLTFLFINLILSKK